MKIYFDLNNHFQFILSLVEVNEVADWLFETIQIIFQFGTEIRIGRIIGTPPILLSNH